jgi:hypothetical protein
VLANVDVLVQGDYDCLKPAMVKNLSYVELLIWAAIKYQKIDSVDVSHFLGTLLLQYPHQVPCFVTLTSEHEKSSIFATGV